MPHCCLWFCSPVIFKKGPIHVWEAGSGSWVRRYVVVRRPHAYFYNTEQDSTERALINLSSAHLDGNQERQATLEVSDGPLSPWTSPGERSLPPAGGAAGVLWGARRRRSRSHLRGRSGGSSCRLSGVDADVESGRRSRSITSYFCSSRRRRLTPSLCARSTAGCCCAPLAPGTCTTGCGPSSWRRAERQVSPAPSGCQRGAVRLFSLCFRSRFLLRPAGGTSRRPGGCSRRSSCARGRW